MRMLRDLAIDVGKEGLLANCLLLVPLILDLFLQLLGCDSARGPERMHCL